MNASLVWLIHTLFVYGVPVSVVVSRNIYVKVFTEVTRKTELLKMQRLSGQRWR